MKMRDRRRLAALLAAGLLCLGLTACSVKIHVDIPMEEASVETETPEGEASVETEASEEETTEGETSAEEEAPSETPEAETGPGVLPVVYDPRPDRIQPVRYQYWGTCWAMSGISTLETCLIRQGLADSSVDLSEEDVLWWANTSPSGGWKKLSREDGGYAAGLTGYLETVGARLESDIPYLGEPEDKENPLTEYFGEGENQRPENYDTAPVVYDVTGLLFFDEPSEEDVKRAILNYGAVTASYREIPDEYVNYETASCWCPVLGPEYGGTHSISIVGWDDTYPKENFLEINGQVPGRDGAWLIKNSFGMDYGSDGGYIHVSYDDGYLLHAEVENHNWLYTVNAARPHEPLKRYAHDEFGAVGVWNPGMGESCTWAVCYDFGRGEKLRELRFASWSGNASYALFYAPVIDGVPSADSGSWSLLAEGASEYSGYITAEADPAFVLPEGRGAIVLTLNAENPGIGTDENFFQGTKTLFNTAVNEGDSFLLQDGVFVQAEREKTMNDHVYSDKVDVCIRAYTSGESE